VRLRKGATKIHGLDQLRKHVPELNSVGGVLRLLFIPILLYLLITAFFASYWLTGPLWRLGAEILLGCLGFGLLYQFFRHRQEFRARFGPLAYSRAASRYGLPGIAIITAVIVQIRYVPGPEIARFWGGIVILALGWALAVAGTLFGLRTVQTFGVDNLTMLYVYFPEESHLVNHKIYNVMRHPAYAAVLCIAFGLALINGSWTALASALLLSLGFWGWVRLVEENELITRFGPAYIEYRQRVPAFFPHPRDLSELFTFLIAGK
jgi:protein-S-isoprenylcysteine O-methyltransferase Ste14